METTLSQFLFCDLLYLIGFIALNKTLKKRRINKIQIIIGVCVLFAICLFSYVGNDYWHYYEWYTVHHTSSFNDMYWEPVYFYLAGFAPSYFIFRLFIWGSAVVLVLLAFKFYEIDFSTALFFFIVRNFLYFSYARVSLAMALMFCGAAMLMKLKDRKYIIPIIGVFLIIVSIQFHKSALFGVGIVLLSLLLLKQNRLTLYLLIALTPLFIYILSSFVADFMAMDLSESELGLNKAQDRLTLGLLERNGSITQWTIDIVWRSSFFICLIMYFRLIIDQKFRKLPISIRFSANATVLALFFSLCFLLVPTISNYLIYYRFLYFAIIPAIIFVTYCHRNRIYPKFVMTFYYTSLLSILLYLIYRTSLFFLL